MIPTSARQSRLDPRNGSLSLSKSSQTNPDKSTQYGVVSKLLIDSDWCGIFQSGSLPLVHRETSSLDCDQNLLRISFGGTRADSQTLNPPESPPKSKSPSEGIFVVAFYLYASKSVHLNSSKIIADEFIRSGRAVGGGNC